MHNWAHTSEGQDEDEDGATEQCREVGIENVIAAPPWLRFSASFRSSWPVATNKARYGRELVARGKWALSLA